MNNHCTIFLKAKQANFVPFKGPTKIHSPKATILESTYFQGHIFGVSIILLLNFILDVNKHIHGQLEYK